MKKYGIIFVLLLALINFSACKEQIDDPTAKGYQFISLTYPDHFPELDIPAENPMIQERVDLGRMLYYSSTLSRGGPMNGMSCATCHLQKEAFTSTLGTAILPHINLGWNKYFLWNGLKEGKLEDIMLFEVRDFFETRLDELEKDPQLSELYHKAFIDEKISYENLAKALSQFARTLQASNSKFDQFIMGKIELTESETRGYQIFNSERGDCFHCHGAPLFTDNSFHNIGLEVKFAKHPGRYEVTGKTGDVGSYKTPTLRNIALTAPYMHDDRFQSLEEVIEHYNSGVKISPVLDPIMTKSGKETGLRLTAQEKTDVINFLKTLTDTSFLSNPAFSSPY